MAPGHQSFDNARAKQRMATMRNARPSNRPAPRRAPAAAAQAIRTRNSPFHYPLSRQMPEWSPVIRNVTEVRGERKVGGLTEWKVRGDGMGPGEFMWMKSNEVRIPHNVLITYFKKYTPWVLETRKQRKEREKREAERRKADEERAAQLPDSPSYDSSTPAEVTVDGMTYRDALKICELAIDNVKVDKIFLEVTFHGIPAFLIQDPFSRMVTVRKSWLIQKYGLKWADYLFNCFAPRPDPTMVKKGPGGCELVQSQSSAAASY